MNSNHNSGMVNVSQFIISDFTEYQKVVLFVQIASDELLAFFWNIKSVAAMGD